MDDFKLGFLLGLLVGEGHFGGDGRQPQITLRMHARHHRLFEWLTENVPGSRLYGPYTHGGRNYYQWMLRGESLRKILPLLDALPIAEISPVTHARYEKMKADYGLSSERKTKKIKNTSKETPMTHPAPPTADDDPAPNRLLSPDLPHGACN